MGIQMDHTAVSNTHFSKFETTVRVWFQLVRELVYVKCK